MDQSRLILELREKTGAGMMDCKRALTEADGSVEAATTALRKKGLADTAKRSARVTKEGVVAYHASDSSGAIIELNCETDFVARLEEFGKLAETLADRVAQGSIRNPEDARDAIQPVAAKLGENVVLRRLERVTLSKPGVVAGYVHLGGKKGALIGLEAPSVDAARSPFVSELAKELLLQVVAMTPKYLDRLDVPSADVDKEREIFMDILHREGKPEASIPKIVEGKLNKLFYQAQCLLEQVSVRDNKTPVRDWLKKASADVGGPVSIAHFVRFQLGE